MTIDDPQVVDFSSFDEQSLELRLLIADHLPWHENGREHLLALLEKLNVYVAYIESGQVFESHPRARSDRIVIGLCCLHAPTVGTLPALQSLVAQCEKSGLRLEVLIGEDQEPLNVHTGDTLTDA